MTFLFVTSFIGLEYNGVKVRLTVRTTISGSEYTLSERVKVKRGRRGGGAGLIISARKK